MKGILNREVEEAVRASLDEAGLKSKEIDDIVLPQKKKALKDAVIKKLKQIISHIEKDEFSVIYQFLENSPAGDDFGCENKYISFEDETGLEDIGDVLDELQDIDSRLKGGKK